MQTSSPFLPVNSKKRTNVVTTFVLKSAKHTTVDCKIRGQRTHYNCLDCYLGLASNFIKYCILSTSEWCKRNFWLTSGWSYWSRHAGKAFWSWKQYFSHEIYAWKWMCGFSGYCEDFYKHFLSLWMEKITSDHFINFERINKRIMAIAILFPNNCLIKIRKETWKSRGSLITFWATFTSRTCAFFK